MKNIILYMLILALLVMPLAGCGSPAPEAPKETEAPTTGLPNPVHEVDEAGLAAATGISLPAPQGAEDVRWSYIEQTGDVPISQMNFILDGAEAYLRAQPTAELEAGDISGLYYNWPEPTDAKVGYCDAKVYTNGEAGYIAWLDVVPGILYNLGMTKGASSDKLTALANAAFVPLQGDAEGDDLYAPYRAFIADLTECLESDWEETSPSDLGVSDIFAYGAKENMGWLQRDINADGIDELLLGEITQGEWTSPIYNAFTLSEDGEPVRLLEGWERNRWYLLEDGTLVNEGASSAFESFCDPYGLVDGELVPVNRAVERNEYLDLPFQLFLNPET